MGYGVVKNWLVAVFFVAVLRIGPRLAIPAYVA